MKYLSGFTTLLLLAAFPAFPQGRGGGGRQQTAAAPGAATTASAVPLGRDFVRENYTKFEYRIPMRDGVKLFTSVYIPKDVFSDERTYPMLMQRTGYNVAPYGLDVYRASLGPSELFAREKFIFIYQDIRGRFMSEGQYVIIRPHKATLAGPKDTDETTDTWDTIDWLVKHVPGNTGKVGMYGISQPGFYVTAGMIDAHPALVAAAPQAPVTDYYMGDDDYHNGAFMLAHRISASIWASANARWRARAAAGCQEHSFDFGTPDGYEFYLQYGFAGETPTRSISNTSSRYWNLNIDHPHDLRRYLAVARDLEVSEEASGPP